MVMNGGDDLCDDHDDVIYIIMIAFSKDRLFQVTKIKL